MWMLARVLSVVALVLGVSSVAAADSLPSCGPGTHMVANPTPPGAMHHGGAYCAPDEPPTNPVPPTPPAMPTAEAPPPPPPPPAAAETTSSGCTVARGRHAMPGFLALTLVAGLAVLSRRRA